jgi:hypothetical protein
MLKSSFALLTALAAIWIWSAANGRAQPQPASPSPHFRNLADSAGLHFVHHHSPTAGKYFVESAPGGLAVFDYNGDRRPDIFFTNGAETPSLEKTSPKYWNRLYRNDGGMRFTDVTDAANVRGVGYAMGAAAADYDNDGDVDLFVAGVRQNQLLRNRGDGRFEDVTREARIGSGEWAIGGAWLDYDADGRLDLFVVNYLRWSPETNRSCGDEGRGIRIYCHPRVFEGLPNRLYRNRGDGAFEDVSAGAGLLSHVGKGMSAAVADFDRDGRPDVFVTNDAVPNFLFRNNGDGTFSEQALMSGVSVPDSGKAISSMGTDAQDYDNDGWTDIHLTALTGETYPLFRNDLMRSAARFDKGSSPELRFVETTQTSGLAPATVKRSGWCSLVADVDNDGWKDVVTANSHVNDRIGDYEAVDFAQPNSLFMNDGTGRFRDATATSGFETAAAVHRGCGIADFDDDGRLDIVVLALGARAELWKNESARDRRWVTVRLVGDRSNRDGIGARVTISCPRGRRVVSMGPSCGTQVRTMTTAMGYASSSHAGLHFGLGESAVVPRIEIHWPSGARQVVEDVEVGRVLTLKEGGGRDR